MPPCDGENGKWVSLLRTETGGWTDGHAGAGHPLTLRAETIQKQLPADASFQGVSEHTCRLGPTLCVMR